MRNKRFRPCKRCKPDQASPAGQLAEKIASACRLIESAETPPSLESLTQNIGLSTSHFHRLFKAATGLTPKGYAAAHRANLVRKQLNKSDTVTSAIYDAGYNSNSRFYETSNEVLGMTPSNYRAGGDQTDIRFAVGECSLGLILVAQSGRGICAIFLGDDPNSLVRELQDQFPKANFIGGDAGFERLVAKVRRLAFGTLGPEPLEGQQNRVAGIADELEVLGSVRCIVRLNAAGFLEGSARLAVCFPAG